MLLDDIFYVAHFHIHVEDTFGEDLDDRAFLAKSETSGHGSLDFTCQTFFFDHGLEFLQDLITFRSMAAGATADEHQPGILIHNRTQAGGQELFILFVSIS